MPCVSDFARKRLKIGKTVAAAAMGLGEVIKFVDQFPHFTRDDFANGSGIFTRFFNTG